MVSRERMEGRRGWWTVGRRGRSRPGTPVGAVGRAVLGLAMAALLARPVAAQPDRSALGRSASPAPATGTHARTGLGWGAAAGAGLGGLALGVLAHGLCDNGDCDGSFGEGFLLGAAGGAVAGGIVGTVLGAAFPVGGPAPGHRSGSVRVGFRRGWRGGLDGTGVAAGAGVVRATTARTSFGVELGYLGVARERGSVPPVGGGAARLRQEWRVGRVALVAAHVLGSPGGARPFLLAGFGLYPTVESLVELRGDDPGADRRVVDRSFVPAPGVGVGGGVRIRVADRYQAELRSRLEVVAGIGDNDLTPFLQVGLGLVRGPASPR